MTQRMPDPDLGQFQLASMRPGQEAPDDPVPAQVAGDYQETASMRPGQEAPDDPQQVGSARQRVARASMRPGQEAPDDPPTNASTQTQHPRFNEAGARSPG